VGREFADLSPVALDDLAKFVHACAVEPDLVFAGGQAGADLAQAGVDLADAALQVHQLGFERRPLLVELGQTARPGRAFVLEGVDIGLLCGEGGAVLVVLVQGVGDPQFLQPAAVLLVVACLAGLVLDASQSPLDFVEDIAEAQEVLLGASEFPFGLFAFGLVLGDAGGFLEDEAAFVRVGLEQHVHLALFDEAVGIDADAGVHEEFADVAQAAGLAVQEVLRLAAAVQTPADFDFRHVDGERSARVVEREGGFRKAEASPALGPGEDDVGHFAAAKALGALLAEDPLDGIDDVRLAAPVRSDDDRDARVELEPGPVRKGLESEEFQSLEFHAVGTPLCGV